MEVVSASDAFGDSPIDGIFRGGQCSIDFVSLASKPGSLGAYWPYGGAINVLGPTLGILYDPNQAQALPIGQLASNIAKPLVLTVTPGTPASSVAQGGFGLPNSPMTLTGPLALLKENFPAKLLFSSKLRKVPISLRFWPYADGSSRIRFFSTS
jgi:hypothetical protein